MIDHRLRTLRVLASEGTVTAAALTLHLTPSTVSQQLRHLAEDLGVRLLEPDGRRVRLTAAALAIIEHADILYAQWERTSADLDAYRDGEAGHLRIAGIATALSSIIAPAMVKLRRQYPRMTFDLGEYAGENRFKLLVAGQVDIAVIIPTPDGPAPNDGRFEQQVLLEEPQDLLVPAQHRFALRDDVSLSDAAEEIWIQAGDQRDQHQLLLSACAAAGFMPRLAHNAIDWCAVGALVAHGYGICLFPRLAHLTSGQEVKRVRLVGAHAPVRRLLACIRRGSADQFSIASGLSALRGASDEWKAQEATARS